jgi:hypothetical protein
LAITPYYVVLATHSIWKSNIATGNSHAKRKFIDGKITDKYWLVGGLNHPEINMSSSMGRIIPYIMENKKCSKPPTSIRIFQPPLLTPLRDPRCHVGCRLPTCVCDHRHNGIGTNGMLVAVNRVIPVERVGNHLYTEKSTEKIHV